MARRYADQGLAILTGYKMGAQMARAFLDAKDQGDLADAMKAATTEERTSQVEVSAPDPAQYTKDSETGNYTPSLAAVQSGVAKTLAPVVEPKYETKTERVDRQFASPQERRRAMLQAGIDFWTKKGDTDKALDLQDKMEQHNLRQMQVKAAQQKQSDDEELRNTFAVGKQGQPGLPTPAATPENNDLNTYLKTMAPRAVQTLLKQGKIQEAKQFSDFVESENGKAYATRWMKGVRLHAIGDSAGALAQFKQMYDAQDFPDGHRVEMTPLEDGRQYRIDQVSADGQILGSKTGLTADLANQAAMVLSPMTAAKFMAEQQAQREKEAALLDRQLQVKQLDVQRDEAKEDRRDERLAARLAVQAKRGGLTLTQQRDNEEIEAARQAISGIDAAELRRLTAKTTNTGRENPDYRPDLEHAARRASRRKVGVDDEFDRREHTGQAGHSALDRAEITKRFRADRSMDNHTLGKETQDGIEVLRQGKVIGHYR